MKDDYERIAAAIRFIDQHVDRQPGLEDIAARLNLSSFHLQRLFRRWAGVTPKRFLQFLTVEHAKRMLEQSHSLLDTSFETGLSGPGRLHDHFVSLEAMSPGEYKTRGAGLTIRYGSHPSPFGAIFLAITERGICALSFHADAGAETRAAERLQQFWRGARVVQDPSATDAVASRLFEQPAQDGGPVHLLVKGTNFQIKVWRALLNIPPGMLRSYDHIARVVGKPKAARAVGGAVGANPIAYLIPCHRVIRSLGIIGGYRWGTTRKRALIAWEAGRW
jgi:AraC family transcriptional regulator of adaptative response/methylated-DNA-[protein]-cysteine methyltransferase